MTETIGTCMVCKDHILVRYIALYVIGSEGLLVCHTCEMQIVEFVRYLTHVHMEAWKRAYLCTRRKP